MSTSEFSDDEVPAKRRKWRTRSMFKAVRAGVAVVVVTVVVTVVFIAVVVVVVVVVVVFAVVVMAEMYKVSEVAIVVKVDPSVVVDVDMDVVVDMKTSKVEVIVQSPLG